MAFLLPPGIKGLDLGGETAQCQVFPTDCLFFVHKKLNDQLSLSQIQCVKSVHIRIFSGPYFPVFGLNADQKNSEHGNFSLSDTLRKIYKNPRIYGLQKSRHILRSDANGLI